MVLSSTRAPCGLRVAGVLALFVAIVALDFAVGSDLTLRAVYVLPIAAAAWTLSRRWGIALSALSVVLSVYFDVATGLTRTHPRFVWFDGIVRLMVYVGAALVLDRLRTTQALLDELARVDPLTGLFNRRGFEELAARELALARRRRTPTTIVGIDLDGFKTVNDTLGHAAGDAVLATIGEVLRSGRATDIAGRLGGDEFELLLPHTDADVAARAVERIRSRIVEAMRARGWSVSASVGVVTYRDPPSSVEEMLRDADAAMYAAKRDEKGGVTYRELGEPGARSRGE